MKKDKNNSDFLKKLLYKSNNRGCKETDLIIGGFVKEKINDLNNEELLILEQILELPDALLYDWYTKKIPVPQEHNTPLMQKILNYKTY